MNNQLLEVLGFKLKRDTTDIHYKEYSQTSGYTIIYFLLRVK